LRAKYCIFKGNFYPALDIAATCLPWSTLLLAAAKETTEDITKPEIAEVEINILASTRTAEPTKTFERVAASAIAPNTRMTELVIALLFGRVFKNFVGFVYFLKLGFVAALLIGVQFYGLTTKCFFDFVCAGVFTDA
jgi:hypothetical protein